MKGQIDQLPSQKRDYALPLDEHTADSKWQFCNCRSCQDYRFLIESQPGKQVDFSTYRKKDEKY